MPISATGDRPTATPNPFVPSEVEGRGDALKRVSTSLDPNGQETGFTLVELMIVIAIIGVMSAVVALTIPDPRGRLVDAAERFAARTQVARDGAVVSGRATSLAIDPLGYAFQERSQGDWRPVMQREMARADWGEGIGVAIGRESRKTIVFDTTGLASEPAIVTLRREGQQVSVQIDQDGTIRVAS